MMGDFPLAAGSLTEIICMSVRVWVIVESSSVSSGRHHDSRAAKIHTAFLFNTTQIEMNRFITFLRISTGIKMSRQF